MTRADIMAARAALPPTQTMHQQGGLTPETSNYLDEDDESDFNPDGSASQGMDRPKPVAEAFLSASNSDVGETLLITPTQETCNPQLKLDLQRSGPLDSQQEFWEQRNLE